tara:strand:- start:1163 stop:1486 length:324 start_codon:yes stop_codon:yes gene_type:complete
MSIERPDNWVVLKIANKRNDEILYKVLAGWSGGYLGSDGWRLNSGITEVEIYGEHYIFRGYSGSEYWCHMETYGLKMNNAGVWKDISEAFPDTVSLMDEKTNWSKLV